MNLEKELLKGHNRALATKIAKWAIQDKAHMAELMEVFFKNVELLTQRAAWSVNIAFELDPEIIKPYLKKMVLNLKKPVHDAVKRNTVRILGFIETPKAIEGETVDICFNLMADPKEAIAVRAFAMTVVFNLLPKYPELKNEFKVIVEDQLPFATAAFKSRGNKYLMRLEKEKV